MKHKLRLALAVPVVSFGAALVGALLAGGTASASPVNHHSVHSAYHAANGGKTFIWTTAGGDPFVPGGIHTHAQAVADIKSSRTAAILRQCGLSSGEVSAVQAQASKPGSKGVYSTWLTNKEHLICDAEGYPDGKALKNVIYENANDPLVASYGETVTYTKSCTTSTSPWVVSGTFTGTNGTVTVYQQKVTSVCKVATIKLLFDDPSGNPGIISVVPSTTKSVKYNHKSTFTPPPAPAYSCTGLAVEVVGQTVTATAGYNDQNVDSATVTFTWTASGQSSGSATSVVGSGTGTATQSFTSATGGTYVITATITAYLNGQALPSTDQSQCTGLAVVSPPPSYSCTGLIVEVSSSNHTMTAVVDYSVSNVDSSSVSVSWTPSGGSSTTTSATDSGDNQATATLNYSVTGDYTVVATVTAYVNGQALPVTDSSQCTTTVNVPCPPPCSPTPPPPPPSPPCNNSPPPPPCGGHNPAPPCSGGQPPCSGHSPTPPCSGGKPPCGGHSPAPPCSGGHSPCGNGGGSGQGSGSNCGGH